MIPQNCPAFFVVTPVPPRFHAVVDVTVGKANEAPTPLSAVPSPVKPVQAPLLIAAVPTKVVPLVPKAAVYVVLNGDGKPWNVNVPPG